MKMIFIFNVRLVIVVCLISVLIVVCSKRN